MVERNGVNFGTQGLLVEQIWVTFNPVVFVVILGPLGVLFSNACNSKMAYNRVKLTEISGRGGFLD